MKLAFSAISIGAAAVALGSLYCLAADKPAESKKKLLFYSQSLGFRHSVVVRPVTGELAYAEKMLKEIAGKGGYEVMVTQDPKDLDNLKDYAGVVLYTTGNPMINRDNLLKFVRDGGALIGIHTATDSYHSTMKGEVPMGEGKKAEFVIPDWPEYIKVMGAAFRTHGAQADAIIKVNDPKNPATSMIKDGWTIHDEMYLFSRYNEGARLLLSMDTDKMDEATLKELKLKKGEFAPVSWTNTEGKGRVFYTSLGHREDVWTNPVYQQHLLGGINWALGQAE